MGKKETPEKWVNARGKARMPEEVDPVPMEPKPGTAKPESLESMLSRMVQNHVAIRTSMDDEIDTFEEADDFEEDDPEIMDLTQHQIIAMTPEELQDYAPAPLVETETVLAQDEPPETAPAEAPPEMPTGDKPESP